MIPVTDQQKQAYMTGTQKYLTLRFSDGTTLTGQGANSQINEGSMKLEQTLCDEEQLHFGRCNAASFSVQIVASAKRYKGLFVYPTITSNDVSFTLGKFRIDNDELTDDRYYRTLKCYDQMTDLMTDDVSDWYANIHLPMTLKSFRDSLFSYFNTKYGVTQAPLRTQAGLLAKLPNDDMIVQRTLDYGGEGGDGDLSYTTNMNGQLMLEKICEINGCFGVINEDGQFEYRFLMYDEKLYPADDLYPANDLYPIGATDIIGGDPDDVEANFIQASLMWQEYEYQPITKVQVHQTENDVGAIVGEDGNDYEVYDNFLVYGMDSTPLQTVAQNLLDTIKKTISYTPAKVSVRGRPWVQTGDLLDVVCRGRTVTFPLLNRTMSGITALKDEYEAKGQEYFTFNVTESNHEFYGILQKTYEITKNVNGLRAYARQVNTDLTTFESEITQTAEQIQTRVSTDEGYISTLTQRCDSINLSVSSSESAANIVAAINAAGSTVKISADHITLTGYVTFENLRTSGQTEINGGNIMTNTLVASQVVTAWNNGNASVSLDANGLHAYGTTFDGGGVEISDGSVHVGTIGGTHWLGNESYKGIAFNLDRGFMTWGYNGGSGSTYYVKLIYDSTGGAGNLADSLNLGCQLDCHNNTVRNADFKDISGDGVSAVSGEKICWVMGSNGQSYQLTFREGILVGTSF